MPTFDDRKSKDVSPDPSHVVGPSRGDSTSGGDSGGQIRLDRESFDAGLHAFRQISPEELKRFQQSLDDGNTRTPATGSAPSHSSEKVAGDGARTGPERTDSVPTSAREPMDRPR